MHTIKIWRDPYDMGWSTTRRKEIEFQPGVTVLVGCNGIGKSTLLHNIQEQLKEEFVPYYSFNNLKDGGNTKVSELMFKSDYTMVANMITSSEGENISNNISIIASNIGRFVTTGDNGEKNPFIKIVEKEKENTSKERWILLDAMDSGYSIDNVIELKDFFDLILDDSQRSGLEVYIVVSANEYELAANMNCLDVAEGKYVTFDGYDDFKQFILKSREKKNKRYEV